MAGKIILRWADRNTNEEAHNIYRSTSPMDANALPTAIASLGPNIVEYTDTNVVEGTAYYYRVGAVKSGFEKVSEELLAYSNISSIHDVFFDGTILATYPFNGDANDLGGTYNGVVTGTPTYTTGKYGQAIDLVGSSYVSGLPVVPAGNWSYSFWSYVPTGLNLSNVFSHEYAIVSDGNEIFLPSGQDYLIPPTPSDVFFHICFVVNAGELKIYIDGEDIALTSGGTNTITWPFDPGAIGKSGSYYLSDGVLIDQFRIFNRPLTASEVSTLAGN